jgi:dephospho-CoA kinase
VFDIPLLVESAHWRQKVERVLVVDCSAEVQCQRVMARSQLTRAEVEAIVASQATQQRRLAAADVVIFNEQLSLTQLALEVKRLAPVFGLSSG